MRSRVAGIGLAVAIVMTLLGATAPKSEQIRVDAPLLPVVASVRCTEGVIEVSFKDKPSEWVKTTTKSCGTIATPPPGQKWVCDVGCTDSHGCTWCCHGHYTKNDVRRFE